MNKFIFVMLGVFTATSVQAATWYVRADGGGLTQCDGQHDASYPGKGNNQPCAYSHPFYVTGVIPNGGGAQPRWQGGDTLMIGPGQYKMGYGAPNTDCAKSYPYDCHMRSIPSGTPFAHTKILGQGYDQGCKNPPEFWGTEKAYSILDLQGASYVDAACLEITDHSSCRQGGSVDVNRCPGEFPFGDWGQNGILAVDSYHVNLTDVNVHGLAYAGLYTARIGNWTMERVKLNGNGQVGWHGEYNQGNSSNSGDIILRHAQINWNGCAEKYPEKTSPVPGSCCSQGQTCYTDGIGMADSGGNYLIEDSEVSWNSEDGIDLLHVTKDPTSTIVVRRTRAEGNSGNDLKTGAAHVIIENNVLISGCDYIANNFAAPGYDNRCRAGGEPLAINVQTGSQQRIYHNTIIQTVPDKNASIVDKEGGPDCDGSEVVDMQNNTWLGGNYQMYDDVLSGAACSGWNTLKSIQSRNSIQFGLRNPIEGKGNSSKDPRLPGFPVLKYTPGAKVER